MDNQYLCPHCRGHLRVGDYIVFKIRNTRREKGLLLLHFEDGNYSSMTHPHFNVQEGERIDYFCPLCMQYLDAAIDENLIHVIMIDSHHTEQEICFSRIAGENSHQYTHFKMSDETIQYLQG